MEKAETSSQVSCFLSSPSVPEASGHQHPKDMDASFLCVPWEIRDTAPLINGIIRQWQGGGPGQDLAQHPGVRDTGALWVNALSRSAPHPAGSALSFPKSVTKSGKVVLSCTELLRLHFGKLIFTLPQNSCVEPESPGTPSEPEFRSLTASDKNVHKMIVLRLEDSTS